MMPVTIHRSRRNGDFEDAVSLVGNIDHVEVAILDDAVQVDVDEILSRRRSPMAEQHVLDVRERERPLEQGIIQQINLGNREIVRRPPVGVDLLQQFGSKGVFFIEC